MLVALLAVQVFQNMFAAWDVGAVSAAVITGVSLHLLDKVILVHGDNWFLAALTDSGKGHEHSVRATLSVSNQLEFDGRCGKWPVLTLWSAPVFALWSHGGCGLTDTLRSLAGMCRRLMRFELLTTTASLLTMRVDVPRIIFTISALL